jgi:DNA-binding HxlR family transcriptional regulator
MAKPRAKIHLPRPGTPVRGSTSGRPIMALLDLLGRRWTLRILWELRDGAAQNFRALRERCDDVSPTVLTDRLRELRDGGVVELVDDGYRLTARGNSLLAALAPLNAWATDWARRAR